MGLRELTSPGRGGRGGAWWRTAQTGSFGMQVKWRGRAKTTTSPGNGRPTDGHMPHCVEPRRTTRMGSRKATGKSSQTHVARHRWARTRQECDDSDRHIWLGRSGDHTRSWSKSCVMPFERGKGNSSVKTILNAAAMAYTVGVVSEPVPKRLWKAFKAVQRAGREVHTGVGQF